MNYKINTIGTIALCASILLTNCNKEIIRPNLDTELDRLYIDHNLPSLSACVFTENGIKLTKYLGYADKEKEIRVGEETIYHIGSISKLFIVTAIMQLEEKGKLDLDEDINTYLPVHIRHPDFPNTPITIRMLLSHTSGLAWPKSYDSQQGMWNNFPPDQGPAPSEWIPDYLIPSGARYDANLWKPLQPGEQEMYSNIGTCMAAYVVEQVSGKNFRAYCQEHIFLPLDMQNTSYNYADLDPNKIALLYDNIGNASSYYDNRTYVAGGIKSTIADLSHFASCYLNQGVYNGTRVLKEESVNKILEIQNPMSGKCLIWNTYWGGWYGHTGGLDLGTATTLSIHKESKTGFMVFTNTSTKIVHPGGEIYWLLRQKTLEYMD